MMRNLTNYPKYAYLMFNQVVDQSASVFGKAADEDAELVEALCLLSYGKVIHNGQDFYAVREGALPANIFLQRMEKLKISMLF